MSYYLDDDGDGGAVTPEVLVEYYAACGGGWFEFDLSSYFVGTAWCGKDINVIVRYDEVSNDFSNGDRHSLVVYSPWLYELYYRELYPVFMQPTIAVDYAGQLPVGCEP